ncbi:MAG TPA: SpvB/TcaC N-terminal domain-containing protein, partial [Xanthomonadaceae bacterium]|nr:SpvB/TcaC N-terminal domain-containing protein [Xanthomonadaceae bacterium]
MRNKFGAAALCLLLTAVMYAATHGGVAGIAASLSDGTSAMLRTFGVHTAATAPIAPDQPIQSLSSELPSHDPTVGKLAGSGGTSGGAASYTIPIDVPPGRRGMQPSLALEYNSRNGNGIAGMGWSLSGLSSLHRCPATIDQDGIVGAVSLTNADKLCLDGQRLVATPGMTYGQANTTYDTELESFVRVTQLGGDLQSANTYFKVETKSGDILYYGNNSSAAPCANSSAPNCARVIPGGASAPLSWMLAYKSDRVGNYIHFVYSDYGNGEVLLSDIFYTGFGTTDGNRDIHLAYQARPAGTGDNDQSSSYLAGAITVQTQRLASITTWIGPNTNSANEVNSYTLNYTATTSQSTHRSLLGNVQECAFLSGQSACRPPTTFSWQQGPMQNVFQPATLPGGHTINIAIGDLQGNGSHAVLVDSNTSIAYLNADGSVNSVIPLPSGFTPMESYELTLTSKNRDFDRSGRDDLVGVDGNNHIIIYFWDGPASATTFAQAFTRSWDTGIVAPFAPANVPGQASIAYIGDMDGDGRPDIVLYRLNSETQGSCSGQLEVYKNVASTSGPSAPATFPLEATTCLVGTWLYPSNPADGVIVEGIVSVQDINGDGLPDILLSWPGFQVSHPNGDILYGQRGSSYQLVRAPFTSLFPASSPATADEQNGAELGLWIDVNGDGLKDYLHLNEGGSLSLRLNTGHGLGNLIPISYSNNVLNCNFNTPGNMCTTTWSTNYGPQFAIADIDGDGRESLLIPQRIDAAMCARFAKKVGGEYYYSYACPPDPVSGVLSTTWYSNLPEAAFDMYAAGDAGFDGSVYGMDALHFVQTGPSTFQVVQEQTTRLGSGQGQEVDLYGDGLSDSLIGYRG